MSERLERVTAFSELREGMKVWLIIAVGCIQCGSAKCHHIVLDMTGDPCGEGEPTIKLTPCNPICSRAFVCICAARDGELWRVADGLEEPSTETAAATPKETADVLD